MKQHIDQQPVILTISISGNQVAYNITGPKHFRCDKKWRLSRRVLTGKFTKHEVLLTCFKALPRTDSTSGKDDDAWLLAKPHERTLTNATWIRSLNPVKHDPWSLPSLTIRTSIDFVEIMTSISNTRLGLQRSTCRQIWWVLNRYNIRWEALATEPTTKQSFKPSSHSPSASSEVIKDQMPLLAGCGMTETSVLSQL